jgi:hydrogenase 3 maturation protease
MSKPSWQSSLRKRLNLLKANKPQARLALAGIGNLLRGDDAAGILIARALARRPALQRPNLLVLDTGGLPENFTGVLRRFNPDAILFIDAAELGAEPGVIEWVEWERLVEHGFSHGLPLSTLAKFLREDLDCWIGLIAIQGQNVDFDDPVSPVMRSAIRRLVDFLQQAIS